MKKSIVLILSVLAVMSCSTQRKIDSIKKNGENARLTLADESRIPDIGGIISDIHRDTLIVQDADGHDMIIMKAVKDENGDMVAHDVIDAAVVTARFRNVAERHGKVDIRFTVTVPASMLDSRWQMRMSPEMSVMGKAVELDPVVITGREYRKAQMKGYQQYERFINSIVTDTTQFIWMHELEVFLHRNIPDLYMLKTDSTFVSDEQFSSIFGVTEQQAVDHYTNQLSASWNRKKIERKDKMFSRYVKVPIITEGLRLDTVLTANNGDFIYEYTQSVNTVPDLRKIDVALSGGIYEEDRKLYSMPSGDPLTFYISSLSTLCSEEERYVTQILERRLTANSTYWIDFEQGRHEIDPSINDNAEEIRKIKGHLRSVMENVDYDLDSIIVTASCSPEGSFQTNRDLSSRRSKSVSAFFEQFCKEFKDSTEREAGFSLSLDGELVQGNHRRETLKFVSRNVPENWEMLRMQVSENDGIRADWKEDILGAFEITDPDMRERHYSTAPYYEFLKESIYPKLRTVRFDFHLHRKGMIKDTVHTTVIDTTYMKGLQAIKDRNYQDAVTILRPYQDYNAAVAFSCMDYNESALAILEKLESTPSTDYLMAVILSRKGMVKEAVQHYLDACRKDAAFIHRGNLDPEISELIKQYNLNSQWQ